MSKVTSPIIVALDYPNQQQALAMAKNLDPKLCRVKVGKELFTRAGPALVEELQKLGFEVFLDLKFHDIPNTAAQAVKASAELGVWMLNVHASGGKRMLLAAREAREQVPQNKSLLIAVTVLTSMEQEDLADIGLDVSPLEQVQRLAQLTADAGLDGVVCSAQEATHLRQNFTDEFKLVTPGIRPASAAQGDQRRILTPEQAIAAGSSYLVIGRPITQAADPSQALTQIVTDIESFS